MANGRPKVKKMNSRVQSKHREHPKIMETAAGHFYHKVDPRLRQELMDSMMISEDNGSVANLSRTAIHRQFNPNRYMESLGFFDEKSEI